MGCVFTRRARGIRWARYFSGFRDFSGGYGCVLVQMLLIQTVFSMQFCIGGRVVLSSVQWCGYFVCGVDGFGIMVDIVRDPNKFQIL